MFLVHTSAIVSRPMLAGNYTRDNVTARANGAWLSNYLQYRNLLPTLPHEVEVLDKTSSLKFGTLISPCN